MARTIPGQSIAQRLFDRVGRRASVGPRPSFYHRLGLEDPLAVDPQFAADTRKEMFSFLSASAYYADLASARLRGRMLWRLDSIQHGGPSARIRLPREAASVPRRSSLAARASVESASFLAPLETAAPVEAVEVAPRRRSASPSAPRAARPLIRAVRQAMPEEGTVLRALDDLLRSARPVDRELLAEVRSRVEGASPGSQLTAARRAIRDLRGTARAALRQEVVTPDELLATTASSRDVRPSVVARERMATDRPSRGLRRVLGASPSILTLEAPPPVNPEAPVSERARSSYRAATPAPARALGRERQSSSRAVADARSQQTAGRAGPARELSPAPARTARTRRPTEWVAALSVAEDRRVRGGDVSSSPRSTRSLVKDEVARGLDAMGVRAVRAPAIERAVSRAHAGEVSSDERSVASSAATSWMRDAERPRAARRSVVSSPSTVLAQPVAAVRDALDASAPGATPRAAARGTSTDRTPTRVPSTARAIARVISAPAKQSPRRAALTGTPLVVVARQVFEALGEHAASAPSRRASPSTATSAGRAVRGDEPGLPSSEAWSEATSPLRRVALSRRPVARAGASVLTDMAPSDDAPRFSATARAAARDLGPTRRMIQSSVTPSAPALSSRDAAGRIVPVEATERAAARASHRLAVQQFRRGARDLGVGPTAGRIDLSAGDAYASPTPSTLRVAARAQVDHPVRGSVRAAASRRPELAWVAASERTEVETVPAGSTARAVRSASGARQVERSRPLQRAVGRADAPLSPDSRGVARLAASPVPASAEMARSAPSSGATSRHAAAAAGPDGTSVGPALRAAARSEIATRRTGQGALLAPAVGASARLDAASAAEVARPSLARTARSEEPAAPSQVGERRTTGARAPAAVLGRTSSDVAGPTDAIAPSAGGRPAVAGASRAVEGRGEIERDERRPARSERPEGAALRAGPEGAALRAARRSEIGAGPGPVDRPAISGPAPAAGERRSRRVVLAAVPTSYLQPQVGGSEPEVRRSPRRARPVDRAVGRASRVSRVDDRGRVASRISATNSHSDPVRSSAALRTAGAGASARAALRAELARAVVGEVASHGSRRPTHLDSGRGEIQVLGRALAERVTAGAVLRASSRGGEFAESTRTLLPKAALSRDLTFLVPELATPEAETAARGARRAATPRRAAPASARRAGQAIAGGRSEIPASTTIDGASTRTRWTARAAAGVDSATLGAATLSAAVRQVAAMVHAAGREERSPLLASAPQRTLGQTPSRSSGPRIVRVRIVDSSEGRRSGAVASGTTDQRQLGDDGALLVPVQAAWAEARGGIARGVAGAAHGPVPRLIGRAWGSNEDALRMAERSEARTLGFGSPTLLAPPEGMPTVDPVTGATGALGGRRRSAASLASRGRGSNAARASKTASWRWLAGAPAEGAVGGSRATGSASGARRWPSGGAAQDGSSRRRLTASSEGVFVRGASSRPDASAATPGARSYDRGEELGSVPAAWSGRADLGSSGRTSGRAPSSPESVLARGTEEDGPRTARWASPAAAWARRAVRGGTAAGEGSSAAAGSRGDGLMAALSRATRAEDLVEVLVERGTSARALARELPGPTATMIERIIQLVQTPEGAATEPSGPWQAARGATVPMSSHREVRRDVLGRSRTHLTPSSDTRTSRGSDGVGASGVMKLANKLMSLIHLAEVDRKVQEAQKHVRMAEDTAAARAEGGAGQGGGEAGADQNMNIKALQQEVLESVLQALELNQQRREDPDGRSIWW